MIDRDSPHYKLGEADATISKLRDLLRECHAFLFDDSGTPIAPEDLRERVREQIDQHPLTGDFLRRESAKHPNVINLRGRGHD